MVDFKKELNQVKIERTKKHGAFAGTNLADKSPLTPQYQNYVRKIQNDTSSDYKISELKILEISEMRG